MLGKSWRRQGYFSSRLHNKLELLFIWGNLCSLAQEWEIGTASLRTRRVSVAGLSSFWKFLAGGYIGKEILVGGWFRERMLLRHLSWRLIYSCVPCCCSSWYNSSFSSGHILYGLSIRNLRSAFLPNPQLGKNVLSHVRCSFAVEFIVMRLKVL